MRALAAAVLLAALPAAAEVTVTADVAKSEVTVGERFAVDVHLDGPQGTSWTCPESAGDDRVKLAAAETTVPGVCRYTGVVFAVGDVSVPAIAVGFRLPDGGEGRATTEPVALTVASLLSGEAANAQLDDVRDPLKVPVPAWFWIAAGVLVAGLAVAFWALVRRRRKPAVRDATVPVAPDVEALAALDRLAGSELLERGELKRYYVRLTAVAKTYLEHRLAAPVLEMTSAETAAFLRDHPVGRDHLATVRELTGAADVVKFARGSAAVEDARRQLDGVRAMVAAVEERLGALAAAAREAAAPDAEAAA